MNAYRTYSDISNLIAHNLFKIPLDIDLIVGVPRSGMIPALMIALMLNKPVCDLDTFLEGKMWRSGLRGRRQKFNWSKVKKVLIFDDSVNTGYAIDEVKTLIAQSKIHNKYTILFGCVFTSPGMEGSVDFYFEEVITPRFFEWNFVHHSQLQKACLDIDGVICVDPSPEENDDGEKYIEFLRNAKPLYIPTVYISCFVTSRLEKYRKHTVEWLKKYNINYGELIMLDLTSKKERIKQNAHGKFKAEVYRKRKEQIFIESSRKQAEEIFYLAKKNVLCLENNKLYSNYLSNQQIIDGNKVSEMEQTIIYLTDNINSIKKSYAYRIGKNITYIPRKFLGVLEK